MIPVRGATTVVSGAQSGNITLSASSEGMSSGKVQISLK